MEQISFFQRFSLAFKVVIIFFVIVLLLIPKAMITDLIDERQQRQDETIMEITSSWAGDQVIFGPVLSIPYFTDTARTKTSVIFLPAEDIRINGQVNTDKRHYGLFEAVVYKSNISFDGNFNFDVLKGLNIQENMIDYKNARINIGLSDNRGIGQGSEVIWNKKKSEFNSGSKLGGYLDGISSNIGLDSLTVCPDAGFKITLDLNGSKSLRFCPSGKKNKINIKSNWNSPKFSGGFLPVQHNISNEGFEADWEVSHLNVSIPEYWKQSPEFPEETLGVEFNSTVDNYLKSTRSVKYSMLIIILTIVVIFITEMLGKKALNPVHYTLVGLALCLFYALLVSFSEHVGFDLAYLISSVSISIMIFLFLFGVTKSVKNSMVSFAILSVLYTFIYVIIQMEETSLLIGNIGLFIILALLMYFTIKIDVIRKHQKGTEQEVH